MILVAFNSGCTSAQNTYGLWQYDYGQKLRIQGLDLPTAVEVHFSFSDTKGDSVTRVGVTRDGVTDVPIPDSFLENNDAAKDYPIYAFIYLTDETSGQTEYKITMRVKARPKPEAFDTPEEAELFRDAIAAVNEAADRAGVSEGNTKESEEKSAAYLEATGELARQVASDKGIVAELAGVVKTDKNAVVRLAEETETNTGQVSADKAEVEKLAEEVKTNAELIATDKENVAELATQVAADAKESASNAAQASADAKAVSANKAQVVENTKQVASNTTKVEKYAEQTAKDAEIAKTASEQAAADKVAVEKVVETAVERVTPSIGENGNWFIDGKDTGKPSGGVSSWNDLLDRPFYETTELSVILPEATYHQTVADDGAYIDADFTIEEGKTYTVTINGESRECVAITIQGIANEEPVDLPALPLDDRGSSIVWFPPVLRHAIGGHVAHVVIIGIGSSTFTMSILCEVPKVVTIDPKYIKDMYYTEGGGLTEVFPETTAVDESTSTENDTFVYGFNEDDGMYTLVCTKQIPLTVDETYTVKWNGTDYKCVAQDIEGQGLALGNYGLMMGGTSTGEPFVLLFPYEPMSGVIYMIGYAIDGSTSITLGIYKVGETIHKVDNKYLDLDWLPVNKIKKMVTVFDESVHIRDGGFSTPSDNVPFEITVGETYLVTFDGTEYECVGTTETVTTGEPPEQVYTFTHYWVGNRHAVDETRVDTGEPFCIFYGGDGSTIGQFSVYTTSDYRGTDVPILVKSPVYEQNKLPEKFLPDTVATKDYVEELILGAIGGAY